MTILGAICFGVLKLFGFKHYKYNHSYVIEIGNTRSGMTMGPFIFITKDPSHYLLDHEFGHSLQNCYFGPHMVVISIMSVIRFWYRKIFRKSVTAAYDDIWFEGTATFLGQRFSES